jgi:nitrite reductase/ring-hydroxylating ferredoxin subunit
VTATTGWTPITTTGNVPPREGRAVKIAGLEIAIFNINGRFLTIDNKCPHKGGPLCDGFTSGTTVVCPLHGQRFDLESGMPVLASQEDCLTTYPTKLEGDVILVNLTRDV